MMIFIVIFKSSLDVLMMHESWAPYGAWTILPIIKMYVDVELFNFRNKISFYLLLYFDFYLLLSITVHFVFPCCVFFSVSFLLINSSCKYLLIHQGAFCH